MAIQIGSHLSDARFLKVYNMTRHQMSREKCWTCNRNPADQTSTILHLEPICEVCAERQKLAWMGHWGYDG